MRYKSLLLAIPFMLGVAHAADGVVRHKLGGMPMSESVEISKNSSIVFLSGKIPNKLSKDAPEGVMSSYGDTEAQTINVLEQIKAHLAEIGLEMKDIVKLQVFLVGGEENNGVMDFKGFTSAYTKYFDANAPETLPTRTTVQVAKLGNPLWRVEIEATAVRP